MGESVGGRKAASLPARRKKRRLGQHEAALQRERLLTEIQILSEQAPSQVGFTHKAGVLLGTAWFQATRSRKQGYIARSRLDVAVATETFTPWNLIYSSSPTHPGDGLD